MFYRSKNNIFLFLFLWFNTFRYCGLLKGRYDLTIYLDTDIAKLNHFAAALSSDGEIIIGSFKSSNDYDSFYLLLSCAEPVRPITFVFLTFRQEVIINILYELNI